jgi:hypothetical protein
VVSPWSDRDFQPDIQGNVRTSAPAGSGVLVHECHEPLGLGCSQVDVIRQAVLTGEADGEPAGAGAEGALSTGPR